MTLSLVDPYLKTRRAKIHLEELREKLAAFSNEPCEFIREDDLENQLHILSMKIRDIPDEIPPIAGDVFYCLRAALDQLVWCLAKINATPGYPEHTQFPIQEQRDIPRFTSQTYGVSTEAVKVIECLQPYNAPTPNAVREHLLWRLNKLCNIDKHTRIPIHGITGMVKWDTFVPVVRPKNFKVFEFDNDAVMKIPLSQKSEVALNPRILEFKVLFGDLHWNIECDFAGIETIYEFVTNSVIPRFTAFFH
jgi:hypothetical protein